MAVKPAHHRGTYHVRSRKLVAEARASPFTICHRCGRTLDQHPAHRNGRAAYWTAGHVVDGLVDGPLAPEASVCNFAAGLRRQAMLARIARNPTSESL